MISPDSTMEPTINSIDSSAIAFTDDDVLSDVDQTASQVPRIGGLESRVGQTFTCSVRRDEVLLHRRDLRGNSR